MVGNKKEIINWLLSEDSETIYEIKEHKVRRSLNANSYCWVLIQKIADILGSTKEEIYKSYIKNKGIFRAITINNEAVKTICHSWANQGLGWIYEIVHKGNTTTDLLLYYGTSSYNTKQMSNFVDYIVEEARLLGIETMTPTQILELKERWSEK